MGAVFLKVLNMSISAGWLILAVVLVRFLLKKAPKWVACLLWALAAVRLLCPFSPESALSLLPSGETVPLDIAAAKTPAIHSGISILNSTVNPAMAEAFTPKVGDSANPLQIVVPVLALVWLLGAAAMLIYALISYLKLRRMVSASVPLEEGVLACDEVKSPFILGLWRPKIYVPSDMTGETLGCVLTHERAHLRRRDHWWKPLGFLLLAVYWFQPLCWLGYVLLCRDIEMACDERVIRDLDREGAAVYSQALLDCSFPRKSVAACPLAFGEAGLKQRVKGILNYKKPAFWVVIAALVLCAAVAVCFLTDPKEPDPNPGEAPSDGSRTAQPTSAPEAILPEEDGTGETGFAAPPAEDLDALREKYPEYFGLSAFKGLEVYVWQMAEGSYSWGLMEGTNREKTNEELWNLRGTTTEEMRLILSTYDIPEENVFIQPIQKPISSYIPPAEDVDPARLRELLFGKPVFRAQVAWAGYASGDGLGALFAGCLNPETMAISSVHHLPVFRLETLAELEAFEADFRDSLTLDRGHEEVPSFLEAVAGYDEAFFADHSLVMAYVPAASGSFRFALDDIILDGGSFCMIVVQTNDPETYTSDMAGWLVLVEVPDKALEDCESFDAQLRHSR